MTKGKIVIRSIIVMLIVFIALSWIANRVPKPAVASAVGKPAPSFVLKDQDGKDFSLASQKGHKVLLMFYRGYW